MEYINDQNLVQNLLAGYLDITFKISFSEIIFNEKEQKKKLEEKLNYFYC